jgi:hypothetical protein
MAAAVLDWALCPVVESIPGKVSGAWVFKGTRMPVAIVLHLRSQRSLARLSMLVLFDHRTPRSIARWLRGHTVVEALAKGWDTLTNGELLKAAERSRVRCPSHDRQEYPAPTKPPRPSDCHCSVGQSPETRGALAH